jgi:2-polyprenyl-3-methyl-5-hydroxy-6-metoxy-1,4-benzoquinol methylase
MTNKTQSFFDKYSDGFKAIYGVEKGILKRWIDRWFRKSMLLRFEKTLEGCSPIEGKTALDIGCGPGHYCLALALKGARSVLGIDFSERMIELAGSSAKKMGLEKICTFCRIDFLALDTSLRFDYVIVMGVMDYIENFFSFIQKAIQICSDKVFLSFPAKGGLLAWQRKLRYRFKCPLFLYSEQDIRNLMQELGITEYKIERLERDYFVTIIKYKP